MYFSVSIERVVIVRSQITKRHAVFQHVVYGDQHGMCNRKCGTVLTSSCGDPLVLRREIRPFYRTCRFCTLGQNRLERFVAFCCFPVLSPSCALAVAGANPSPGTKMGGTGESAHIQTDFRQNHLSAAPGYTGNIAKGSNRRCILVHVTVLVCPSRQYAGSDRRYDL